MLMILARLGRSESFWAVAKVRSPHTGPEFGYPRPSCIDCVMCGRSGWYMHRQCGARAGIYHFTKTDHATHRAPAHRRHTETQKTYRERVRDPAGDRSLCRKPHSARPCRSLTPASS